MALITPCVGGWRARRLQATQAARLVCPDFEVAFVERPPGKGEQVLPGGGVT